MKDGLIADAVLDGAASVPAGKATPLSEVVIYARSITIFNRSDRSLGVGGKSLATDEHLLPGDSIALRVSDLSQVHLFQRGPGAVRIPYVYEV